MKLRKLSFLIAATTITLTIAGCGNLMKKQIAKDYSEEMAIQETMTKAIEKDIDDEHSIIKPDLSQLDRNDFNHAALRLNLPIFWMYEETPSKEVKPELLTTLKFYPTSETFQWKNDKGEFTDAFYMVYNQMVQIMKTPDFGVALQKDKLARLRSYKDNFDTVFEQHLKKIATDAALETVANDEERKKLTEDVATWLLSSNSAEASIDIKGDTLKYIDKLLENKEMMGEISDSERTRLAKVAEELDQAAITVVATDFTASDDKEKAFVEAMLKVGSLIDALYAKQVGVDKIFEKIPENDVMSRSMARRNWGINPESPKMKNDTSFKAISGDEKILVGIYPEDLQADPKFCENLDARKDAEKLLDHFSVIVKDGEKLKAVPYNEFFKDEMTAISNALKEAAATLEGNEKEAALLKYLNAAAESFLSNNWNPADEAWAAMNSTNSAWYVRVAPDETYWEPCSRHAGFHMTFARINPDALAWQEKLNPLQQDMEKEMAKIAGNPYKERKVSFHLPDFIDIVTNSGDDRDAFGATIGQSLPNWGPVANEGRGRTVAMSNLYTDPDSLRDRKTLASSLFTEKDMELLKDGKGPGLLSTIIHEAAHNLGPAHEYKVKGKKGPDIFGGELAQLAEEFKAQSAALWFIPYLVKKGVIDQKLADQSYADSVYWAFGHIARGMTNAEGRIQPYSQLAAIQIGMMLEDGALVFDPEAMAANGTDKGAFILNLEKMPNAAAHIMKAIAQSKARGDRASLVKLQKKHIEGTAIPFKLIEERMQRLPKTSFVYSVKTK